MTENRSRTTQQHNEPLSDLAYDWVTIIQHKSEALRAYEQYMQDAQQANSPECLELMRQIYEQDSSHVQQATQHLVQCLQSRMGQGGRASQGSSEPMRGGQGVSQGGMSSGMGQGEAGRSSMRQSGTGSGSMSQGEQGQAASRQSGAQEEERNVSQGGQQRRPRSS